MNDKQKLAAMGAQYRLTEEQAKGLAERMPQTGALQVIDDEPLCMAKRIEELEAQVRALTLPEGWQLVPVEPTERMISESIDAGRFDEDDAVFFWASMIAAAPSPDSAK